VSDAIPICKRYHPAERGREGDRGWFASEAHGRRKRRDAKSASISNFKRGEDTSIKNSIQGVFYRIIYSIIQHILKFSQLIMINSPLQLAL